MSTNHHRSSILKPSRKRMKDDPVENKSNNNLSADLKSVLSKFINRVDISSYEQIVCYIREDRIQDPQLLQLLTNTREIISLLDHSLHHFVEVLLAIKWFKRSDQIAQEYQGFIIDLLSAHNYYTELALEKIVKSFLAGGEDTPWDASGPSSTEQQSFQNTHDLLQCIFKIIPMSSTIFIKVIADCFPYFKRSADAHAAYIYNMLKVVDYRPDMRLDLLLIMFDRFICLDVNAPKSEIEEFEDAADTRMEMEISEPVMFPMDEAKEIIAKEPGKMCHPIANTLDIILKKLFTYIHDVCYDGNEPPTLDWSQTKSLYHDLLAAFDRLILPTLDTHHVQYTIFYLCSFHVSLAENFLNYLWRKVLSPNEAPVLRQTAILYIASLLARAKYIPLIILKNMISKAAEWIHNYISTQDGLENANSDIRVHKVFFAVCQALFYVIAFRHRDLVNTRKNLTYLQSLNFAKIVTSRLNPLRVCIPRVVQNFAAVTRTYQLAYCYTIIEHNARNTIPVVHQDEHGMVTVLTQECLETFFPFDPFVLARCGSQISSIYREYEDLPLGDESVVETLLPIKKEEDDDFLADPTSNSSAVNNADIFSYGTSPGFKHT